MPPKALDRLLDERARGRRDCHVAADGERADPLGLALEQVAPAREHRDVRALVGERLGDRETHAPTRRRRRSPCGR